MIRIRIGIPLHSLADLSGGGVSRKNIPRGFSVLLVWFSGLSLQSCLHCRFIVFQCFSPWYLYLIIAPFLLKCCFAWRSLEEHTLAVVTALKDGVQNGREQVKMLVSRDTANLEREHILSAGYESMTENLTDSIISPLVLFFLIRACRCCHISCSKHDGCYAWIPG